MEKIQKRLRNLDSLFVTAFELLKDNHTDDRVVTSSITPHTSHSSNRQDTVDEMTLKPCKSAISHLQFPFHLKSDQIQAVNAWLNHHHRGSIIYGTGTGKTEIAFECARKMAEVSCSNNFSLLLLVPRIVLIEQNYKRLAKYGIPSASIGRYFGEKKEIREITIATYHSVSANYDIIRNADMVIFDEVHLLSTTARTFSRMFDVIAEDSNKALLGLTATIDETDEKNTALLSVIPPVRKYLIKDAVLDGRLATPIIFPVKVNLTEREHKAYVEYSQRIKRISERFKRYDAGQMMHLMKENGFPRWQAKAWFLNVTRRKNLLASAENKLASAVELIKTKHLNQKIMVFSETLESLQKLKLLLKQEGIESIVVDGKIPSFRRQRILSDWGNKFYPLLSAHTLEIGYDVPEVAIEIILASTSNMNQIVQRIGRVLRKYQGKESAIIYVIYVSDTRDNNILAIIEKAIESTGAKEELLHAETT